MANEHGTVPNSDFKKISEQTSPQLAASDIDLLASLMRQEDGPNLTIPAGYTYLGQFIDHDITFTKEDGVNGRTPQLDLDSLYGDGPGSDKHDHLFITSSNGEAIFKTGNNMNMGADLVRDNNSVAQIPDGRNDENIIVASIHLAMQKFHNKLVLVEGLSFAQAKQTVQWHYQFIVLNDFLRRIVSTHSFNNALQNPIAYNPTSIGSAFIPTEFAGACYRFGHSMVREQYNFNDIFNNEPSNARLFFDFPGGRPQGSGNPNSHQITSIWSLQGNGNSLERFFDPAIISFGADNFSGGIGIGLAPVLFNLQVSSGSNVLALRNLNAGQTLKLPSGQQLITELNAKGANIVPLTSDSLMMAGLPEQAIIHTPLWFYILLEASVQQRAERLGQLGGMIVAETLIGLLRSSPQSIMGEGSDLSSWHFKVPLTNGSELRMVDIIRYLND